MSRDFAKKTTGKKQPRKKKKAAKESASAPIKWLFAGLLLGVSIAILVYFQLAGNKIPEIDNSEKINGQESKLEQKEKYPAVAEPAEAEYEFWELLKNKQVEVPQDKEMPGNKPVKVQKYIMQCGSFKKNTMAQALKAKIALAGFQASIHKTQEKDGFAWHRVVLGPYTSKRKAESDRHRLNSNGISGCRIW
ncbi:MAG TPA: hypothetical protein ENJ60_14975 [Aeromonadales bacterium]|nr:hypothetical protein [Aeromonadales bacterium]